MPNKDVLAESFESLLDKHATRAEEILEADVLYYRGQIHTFFIDEFKNKVENLKEYGNQTDRIAVFLSTGGGMPEAAESIVRVLRWHYKEVYFVVPDLAMSAGTMICMSGNKIFMEYSSCLGPIDPQVSTPDQQGLVPALGYIDKFEELLSRDQLTPGEMVTLNSMDPAKLALFEHARDLGIELVTNWLYEYKFSEWDTHRSTNPGSPVTDEQKKVRAQEIAAILSDHKRWKTHGRHLDLQKLVELQIEIDDYSDRKDHRDCFRGYCDTINAFMHIRNDSFLLHTRTKRTNRREGDDNCSQ